MKSVKSLPQQVITLNAWLQQLKESGEPVLFLGDDVVRFEEEIRSTLGKQACFGTPQENIPRPASLAWLVIKNGAGKKPEPPDFSPEYLQMTEAEANWLKKQRKERGEWLNNCWVRWLFVRWKSWICRRLNWWRKAHFPPLGRARRFIMSCLCVNEFAYYTVATYDEKVIGYCGFWLILDEAHITNIAIHPDYRGRGIGEATLSYVMDLAKKLGAEKMTLEVRVSNEVRKKCMRNWDLSAREFEKAIILTIKKMR